MSEFLFFKFYTNKIIYMVNCILVQLTIELDEPFDCLNFWFLYREPHKLMKIEAIEICGEVRLGLNQLPSYGFVHLILVGYFLWNKVKPLIFKQL